MSSTFGAFSQLFRNIMKNLFIYNRYWSNKNLFFKNHSYIIVFTITNEYRELANFRGWFDIVSNVQIYLANTKDKRALKEAKKVIKIINSSNNTTYTSTLMSTFLKPHNDEIEQINTQKITDNVYTLSLTR